VSAFTRGRTEFNLRGLGAETHIGEHHENGRLVLIVSLRSFWILNWVGGVFSGAHTARRSLLRRWVSITLTARPQGYHLGRVQMEHGTFMGRASTAQALFVHRR
jgi:hypothetical protein